MTDLLAAAAAALLLAAGTVIAWRIPAGGTLTTITPLRLVVLAYLVLDGIGGVFQPFTEPRGDEAAVVIGLVLVVVAAAAAIAARIPTLATTPPEADQAVDGARPVAIAGLAVVGLVALASIALQAGIPLLSADPQIARSAFAGRWFDMFRWLVPPAAVAAFAGGLGTRRRLPLVVGLCALLAVGGIEVLIASRALPFELAFTALLVAWWAGRRPNVRVWSALIAAAVVLFVGVQFARIGPGGFRNAFDASAFAVDRTVNRVLLISPRTVTAAIAEFPDRQPYLLGSTYVRWVDDLAGRPRATALGYVLYDRLFPDQPGGFAAPGLFAEAWANGGIALTIVIAAALGLLAQAWGAVVGRLGPGVADRVLAALVTVALARTYATSLNGFALTVIAAVAWWAIAGGLPRVAARDASFLRLPGRSTTR